MADIFNRLLKQMGVKEVEESEDIDAVLMAEIADEDETTFADIFGMTCTILSCGIAGYQIMQHLRYYNAPAI